MIKQTDISAAPSERIDPCGEALPPVHGEGSPLSIDPERSLWASVIRQAIDDYVKYRNIQPGSAGWGLGHDAGCWLFASRHTDEGSLSWVCQIVGVEPDYVRHCAHKRADQSAAI